MITTNLQIALNALTHDEIVAIPTETVYGLAGNALRENTIRKIFDLKQRPYYNPLIVHIRSVDALHEIAQDIPKAALQLAERFWPGPLTLVLKKKDIIPDLITAGNDTVAVRVPNHPVTLSVLEQLDFPLAAPSANPFGSISPTTAQHVQGYFEEQHLTIIDGGECERGLESTILGFEGEQPVLYRHGAIPADEIEAIAGKLKTIIHDDKQPAAPGMLSRHYAPNTETYLTSNVSTMIRQYEGKRIGLLLFSKAHPAHPLITQQVLSPSGDLREAARNFYAALHTLDDGKVDVILAERLPDEGLGKTLNDRLQRAIQKA